MHEDDRIHVTIPGHTGDPRSAPESPPGTHAHYVPELHPDDVTTLDGIPITTVSRTLIDLAEMLSEDELRGCFERAREQGLLDLDELAASRARVEWRPSLEMLDGIIAEFS